MPDTMIKVSFYKLITYSTEEEYERKKTKTLSSLSKIGYNAIVEEEEDKYIEDSVFDEYDEFGVRINRTNEEREDTYDAI
jgi:hypothetical protein